MSVAIQAEGLAKSFGETQTLDGVDLEVASGTVLGLLGPNGVSKTTAVRILATLGPDKARGDVMADQQPPAVKPCSRTRLIGLSRPVGRAMDLPVDESTSAAAHWLQQALKQRVGGRLGLDLGGS
jgi:ABC-type branched-subunit amino acid transport system ATPase component